MSGPLSIDAARVELMLGELRLPAIKAMWSRIAEQSDKEGWPAARFLAALTEAEMADRGRRRIVRHMADADLPEGKTIDSFEFELVPMVSKAQVMALVAGDSWLKSGANLLLFGGPGAGKSHLAAAIGRGLVENGGACSTPAPPTSCSGCRLPAASWRWSARSPSSTSTTC